MRETVDGIAGFVESPEFINEFACLWLALPRCFCNGLDSFGERCKPIRLTRCCKLPHYLRDFAFFLRESRCGRRSLLLPLSMSAQPIGCVGSCKLRCSTDSITLSGCQRFRVGRCLPSACR
ncbi:MAG: hypothetical protein BGP24_14605 [Lysobacterales bacterium 69-70]|nr:MAG: hypothetical protein ABT27_17800 [Xanthomonadaceae bacterium SCN 69-25]OJY94215.1 MAG: hypothetical protein BGP24_14605 [Xanthomonadales bacterium 69-70]